MFRLLTIAITLFIAISTVNATAQSSLNTPIQFSFSEYDSRAENINKSLSNTASRKSVTLAYGLSVANAAIPLGLGYYLYNDVSEPLGVILMLYGGVVGPSMGSYYAGDFQVGNTSTIIRGIVIGLYATSQLSGTNQVNRGPEVVFYSAIAAFVGTSIYNFVTIPNSVNVYNRRTRFQGSFDMGPSVDLNTGTPIMRASLSF